MRILVVTQYFWPENFKINDLCDGLIERGHDVTVYTGIPNYPEGQFYPGYSFQGPYTEMKGLIKIIRSPLLPRGKNKSLQLILNYFSYFIFATFLAPFLVKGKYDIIFVNGLSPITVAIPGLFLKYIKRIPMYFWVADLWPESLEATGIVKNKQQLKIIGSLISFMYKKSDKVLVTSKGFMPRLKKLGVSDSQLVYFPQWPESLFSRAVDQSFNDLLIPENGLKIMFAGNIGSSQDFPTIVKAAEILRNHKDIFFLILGNGNMKHWALEEVKKLGIEDNFIFLGSKPIEMMPEYYSKADLMLLSLSDTDLFSITVPAKLQSYLAVGKPILASINGEGAAIVNDHKAGLTVEASNPKELAAAILKMKSLSLEELKAIGRNARKCHELNYDRDKQINFLETLFINEVSKKS